ncbi:tetratricopeptide repeat protein [Vibrio sp. JPW-9-11-11]|uniref:tetratricopeptide repeat protein n=1 Tax=Vibrio sp. JPW-9-11-11 TaxID=1416532 RepID=UPI001593E33D|nr:tetratricopeptide repeat protein [Vibrio sp. JPW-9-11-11]NVD06108.1 tetratricopeptide repeat protein [Vibrio sp. JPW-9-11-11]
MVYLCWKRWTCAWLLLLAWPLMANTIYASASLSEANSLVDVVPHQAKQLINNYLEQRTLSDNTEQSPSAMSRDEADSRIRTPGSTIDALRILAQAEFNLGNSPQALMHLREARSIAERYRLPYLLISVALEETELVWLIDQDHAKARAKISQLEQRFASIDNPQQLARGLNYRILMFQAQIASREGKLSSADQLYEQAKEYVDSTDSTSIYIDYHTTVGQHLLANKQYNRALSELLISYWKAIEKDSANQLAEVNRLLGQLFFERKVLDKANNHYSQAADYYDNYQGSPALPPILKSMGDIYYHQGKYNLALVHYFNAMDHDRLHNSIENVIDLHIALASTYLKLVNYPLAEQYLERAQELLQYVDIPRLKSYALLLEAGLLRYQSHPKQAIEAAKQALKIAQTEQDVNVEKHAYQMLYLGYEMDNQYQLALESLKQYNSLAAIEQQETDLLSEDAFRQQKEFVEQTLHLNSQKQELEQTQTDYRKFQNITLTLFILCAILFLFLLRRGHVIGIQNEELDALNEDLYTHSRSGLKNLRMLNARLPASLEESNHKFEKWHVGELIHEPLNDRLRFVMIDVPFLRNMYLQHGYQEGLKLERAFGDFLKQRVQHPARIYHFSDANLLYIEPNSEQNTQPEQLFEKIQQWIMEFEPERRINRIIRIGMADYPFLPRAYTAVNDKELIDVLLMSTSTARTLSMKEHSSQWVYLRAIENAPAASLATGNIRKACKHSINQGLIKVHSSFKNEDSIKKLLKDE